MFRFLSIPNSFLFSEVELREEIFFTTYKLSTIIASTISIICLLSLIITPKINFQLEQITHLLWKRVNGSVGFATCEASNVIFCFQFQVTARDQANPEKTATAQVYVRVRRDLQAPKFESLPYAVTIPETLGLNRVVFRLRGRDDDKMVCFCRSFSFM